MDVVAIWNGHKAHALRIALRDTNEAFAERLTVAVRTVAKWEAQPEYVPGLGTQALLDSVLGAASPEAQLRFRLLVAEGDSAGEHPAAVLPEDIQPLRAELARASQVTDNTLAYLQRVLREHYTADNLMGPRNLLPILTSHVTAIEQLRRTADGTTIDALLRLGAGYAEFTGWLYHDAGDLRAAVSWYARAMEWAQACDHRVMVAFLLMRRAAMALTARDGAYAARLANAALVDDSTSTARVRAIAAAHAAHGWAIAGDADAAEQALAQARGIATDAAAPEPDDPSTNRYCEPGLYVQIKAAFVHLELNQPERAIDDFEKALADLPSDYRRDHGQYRARLAEAHALARQPHDACRIGEEALAIARETGSSRTVTDLQRSLPDLLSEWSDDPVVVRFLRQLTEPPTE